MKFKGLKMLSITIFILFFAFPVSALGIDPVSPSEQELLASFSESNQGTCLLYTSRNIPARPFRVRAAVCGRGNAEKWW